VRGWLAPRLRGGRRARALQNWHAYVRVNLGAILSWPLPPGIAGRASRSRPGTGVRQAMVRDLSHQAGAKSEGGLATRQNTSAPDADTDHAARIVRRPVIRTDPVRYL